MKIMFDRKKMLETVRMVMPVPKEASHRIIDTYLLLKAENGVISVLVTDFEKTLSIDVDGAEIAEEGRALVPVFNFSGALYYNDDETMTLSYNGNVLELRGKNKYRLATASTEEYPALEVPAIDCHWQVSGNILADALKKVVFATCEEPGRWALSSVDLVFTPLYITLVATDGRRLAKVDIVCAYSGAQITNPVSVLVSQKSAELLIKLAKSASGDIWIGADESRLFVKGERFWFAPQLVSGSFPDWQQVISLLSPKSEAKFVAGDLLNALEQICFLCSKENRAVLFSFGARETAIHAVADNGSDGKVVVSAEHTMSKFRMKLDSWYLLDYLRVLDPSTVVTCKIQDNRKPVTFETEGCYLYVLAPIELREEEKEE